MRIGIDARKIADFGIGTYIRGLLTALVDLGDIDYVAFAPANAQLPHGVEHVVVDAPHYSVRELFAVGRAADRARLDVFHAPHYVVPFTRVPVVVTIHDLIHLHRRNPLQRMYAKTMIGRAIRKSRRVLTVSETVARELACDAVVTPNGIDEVFQPANAPREHFLYVGNDKQHKNVGALVDAFARVPDATLVLVGAPFDRFRGRDRVDVRGFVSTSELVSLYQRAIALVMPSIEEGFGLPAAEAMACGAPVITSRAAALVEITGDAALHADDDELADAMLRVARDEMLRASMIAMGLQLARNFTWKRCAMLTRDVYRTV
jgi:glycosyltransferase involved in cell wall biosynthesis